MMALTQVESTKETQQGSNYAEKRNGTYVPHIELQMQTMETHDKTK